MDFNLSEEALELKEATREFTEKRLYPNALAYDEKGTTPLELIEECAELGFMGFTVPEEYGGLGMCCTTFMAVLEDLCAACAGVGILISVHNSLCCEAVKVYGSEETKKKYLPKMAAGAVGSYCLTEPQAGTDIAALSTRAEDKGDHWLMNGTKTFVTSAMFAGVYIVFVKTHPEEGRKGMSCFIVDKDAEGITLGKPEQKMGIKASDTREVNFTDVKVPKENLLGELKGGFKMALNILNSGRIGVSFQSIGIARAALEEAIKYSKGREQFGQPISNFQAIQFKLSEMATRIDAGRLLAYRASELKDAGQPCHRESSMAKLFCSTTANFVCTEAVQIHGGYGYIKEYPVERYFRDARITELYEGTTEAQKMVIARDLLKD